MDIVFVACPLDTKPYEFDHFFVIKGIELKPENIRDISSLSSHNEFIHVQHTYLIMLN